MRGRSSIASAVFLAAALLGCHPNTQKAEERRALTGERLRERAESYQCTDDENINLRKYFELCNTGLGYSSSYCLDRAVTASCHERPIHERANLETNPVPALSKAREGLEGFPK